MAQKVGELPQVTSLDDDDRFIVYDIVAEETSLVATDIIGDSITNVIHTNKPAEISNIESKAIPNSNDFVLIEDSEDAFNKKKIPISMLGGGVGGIPDAPVDSKVYGRKDGGWVRPSTELVLAVTSWEAAVPPEFQLCLVDDIPQVITLNNISTADSRISVDLGLGEITANEDLIQIDMHVALQITRVSGGATASIWGVELQRDQGAGWESLPGSTHYFTFIKEDQGSIKHLSFSVSTDLAESGDKVRLMQVSDNTSVDVGIISSKPFTNMSLSPGVHIDITTR